MIYGKKQRANYVIRQIIGTLRGKKLRVILLIIGCYAQLVNILLGESQRTVTQYPIPFLLDAVALILVVKYPGHHRSYLNGV